MTARPGEIMVVDGGQSWTYLHLALASGGDVVALDDGRSTWCPVCGALGTWNTETTEWQAPTRAR